VSDLAKSKRGGSTATCPRCGATMNEVVTIAPVAGEPGLIAYECPNCGYVTSVLVQPKTATNKTPRNTTSSPRDKRGKPEEGD
jgi:uncharacterized Zn finger protein